MALPVVDVRAEELLEPAVAAANRREPEDAEVGGPELFLPANHLEQAPDLANSADAEHANTDATTSRKRTKLQAAEGRMSRKPDEQKACTFFCVDCDKQYRTATEFLAHESSYDHAHRKRFEALKGSQALSGRTTREDVLAADGRQLEAAMARASRLFEAAVADVPPSAAVAANAPLPNARPAFRWSVGVTGATKGEGAARSAGARPVLVAAFAADDDDDNAPRAGPPLPSKGRFR